MCAEENMNEYMNEDKNEEVVTEVYDDTGVRSLFDVLSYGCLF